MRFLIRTIAVMIMAGGLLVSQDAAAQVTTAALGGTVVDEQGEPLPGAHAVAVHVPSGTRYGGATRADGRFTIRGMRVGGPYTVTVSFLGFESSVVEDIHLSLGAREDLEVTLRETGVGLDDIVVTAVRNPIIRSDRTGASVSIGEEVVQRMPTINRRISDVYRLTPQLSGSSVAGQSSRFNNITVDGSGFNSSFGLGSEPGDRTNVSPISMDAIEQIQVNIAPYDVRQGDFVGGAVNMVTRSGTNEIKGSAYYNVRNESFVGTMARDVPFDPGEFTFNQYGLWASGPIIRDRLFIFANFENDVRARPMTTYRARTSLDEEVGGTTTRVLASDLDQLSSFLRENFDYETGPYQGYDGETGSTKFLVKLDYNLNDRNTLTLRYNHLDSGHDQLMSNSSSLGFGSRRTNLNALNFGYSNYVIQENIRSIIGEWNSRIGSNMANQFFIGYTIQDESRGEVPVMFPMVDILEGGSTYTSFGAEPFTPANDLVYRTYQMRNDLSIFTPRFNWTFGVAFDRFHSETSFFPGSQSVYVYNSLEDFYRDAEGYLANPNRTTSDVDVRRFQVRWSNVPGQDIPVYVLKVNRGSAYAQNEWRAHPDVNLTAGLRVDLPVFEHTGLRNPEFEQLTFRDENGNPVQYRTDRLPNPNLLWSPRIGFNWNVMGQYTTQVRGGTGVFSGRPRYNWLSNQIGNNGMLMGFERVDNTTERPFHPDPHHYKPQDITGEPASSYEVNMVDPGFRFPQVWRTSIGVDQQLPWWDLVGTVEFMHNRDVNGIKYINVNMSDPDSRFTGVDDRPRWTGSTRIHEHIDNAVILTNQGEGWASDITLSLERPFRDGFFGKFGFNYGVGKNRDVAGSVATGSWNRTLHAGNPNDQPLGYSTRGHRAFLAASYRGEYLGIGATTVSIYTQLVGDRTSDYSFSGDLASDGGTSNNKIYIHRDVSEMNFEPYTSGGRTFTAEEQAAAWDAFIEQDRYLRANRGSYAERGAVVLPSFVRADLSIQQELFTNIRDSRNSLQFRVDFLNVGNLLNSNWGVSQSLTTSTPLIARGADDEGRALYRLRNIGGELVSESFRYNSGLSDVFQIQVGLRYTFQ